MNSKKKFLEAQGKPRVKILTFGRWTPSMRLLSYVCLYNANPTPTRKRKLSFIVYFADQQLPLFVPIINSKTHLIDYQFDRHSTLKKLNRLFHKIKQAKP